MRHTLGCFAYVVALVALLACNIVAGIVGIPECAEEDGSGPIVCGWTADIHGNGSGSSFVKFGPLFIQN